MTRISCWIQFCVECTPDRRWHSFPVVIVAELELSVILARYSDLLVVHFMQLQFFAWEVMKIPANNREIIFHHFFLLFFIGFSYYTYRRRKTALVPNNLRSHETWQVLDPQSDQSYCCMNLVGTGDWYVSPSCHRWVAEEGSVHFQCRIYWLTSCLIVRI